MQKLPLTASLLVSLFLFGCGGTTYTHQSADDLKPGPGLFSGKDGVFVLISTDAEDKEEQKSAGKTDR